MREFHFVALSLGKLVVKLVNLKTSNWLTLTIGLAAYTLVASIPVVGGIFSAIALLVGLGAIVISKKEFYKTLQSKNIA